MVMGICMYRDYFNFVTLPFLEGNYFNNIRLLAAQDFILQKLSQGGIAIIGGNKGVGKTRLAHEIARKVNAGIEFKCSVFEWRRQ